MQGLLEFDLTLSAEAFSRWKIGRDDAIPAPPAEGVASRVPLSYLVFMRAQPVLGVNFHELLGRDPDRGLYGGVTYRLLRPLTVGQVLHAGSAVQGRKVVETPRGPLTITTFLTTYSCDGEIHATESVRMIDTPPESKPEMRPETRPDDGAAAAVVAVCEPSHPLLCRIAPITRRQVAWLTVETGDINALHLDASYAAQRGYPDVVVPATLITALLQREVEAARQRVVSEIDVRYSAPTYPGEQIDLYATISGDELTFQALVGTSLRAQGRMRLQAEASEAA